MLTRVSLCYYLAIFTLLSIFVNTDCGKWPTQGGYGALSTGSNSPINLNKNNQLSISCVNLTKGLKLQAKGIVIRTSNVNINNCGKKINFLEIFAEEKVIIDNDFNFTGREMQVAIIAPIWEIIEYPRIILDGVNAVDITYTARNGSKTGDKHGADGLAGLPGGPAGSFYGVANEIINADSLTISAMGGRGGKGQDGGKGANGRDGNTLQNKDLIDCQAITAVGFNVTNKTTLYFTNEWFLRVTVNFTANGTEGIYGGRGGNGGAKGLGGHRGNIILFDFSKRDGKSFVGTITQDGFPGKGGLGQYAGFGGKRGDTVDVECNLKMFKKPQKTLTQRTLYSEYESDGENGVFAKSLKNRKMPKKASIIQNFPQTINEYKIFVRPKLAKIKHNNNPLYSLYDSLNSREEVIKQYDCINLVDELRGLELQYFISEDYDYLLSSYIKLERRFNDSLTTLKYAEKDKIYEDVIKESKKLIEKRTTAISATKGYSVITNITLDLYTNGITPKIELKEHEEVYSKIETFITRVNPLESLMKQAQELIDNDLINAMQDLQNTLDSKIDSLLEEISKLRKSSMAKELELSEKRIELQNAMLLKGIFGVLKIGCGIAAVVNPALGVAASIGSSGLSVIESFLTDPDVSANVAEIAKVGQIISNATDKFLVDVKPSEQEAFFNNHISEMTKDMTKKGKSMVTEMKNRLKITFKKQDTEPQPISYKSYGFDERFENEEKVITDAIDEAKKDDDKSKLKDREIQLSVYKFIKVTNEVLSTASATLTNIMKDVKKVDEIDKALQTNRENLKKLDLVEEAIYAKTEPMLQNMFNDIQQVGNNMGTMNSNQILIAHWNVRDTIQDVQNKVKSTFKDFKAIEEMNWALDKLTATFQVMTDMNKEILNNRDKISDSTFIAALHLPQVSKILIKDHELASSLAALNKVFYQNELKDQYFQWIYSFKQYSFPNAGQFLLETKWPYSVVNKDVDQVVTEIKSNIADFKSFFTMSTKKYRLLANRIADTFRGSCSFDHKAFFVWRNESSKQLISNVLSGSLTTLDAKGSINNVPGLKFNKVGIIFTSSNPQTQQRLFNVLSNFRVSLTHQGDSTYTFKGKTYLVETNPVTLDFNYLRDNNIITGLSSAIHEQFANGDYVLSPYATWTVELISKNSLYNSDSLKEFIGKVDLELIGQGEYFTGNECNKQCEETMLKTYS